MSDHQRRFALIIASDYYTDKKLTQLKAPIVDAERLAELLKDPMHWVEDMKSIFYLMTKLIA